MDVESNSPKNESMPADHPTMGQVARGEGACPFASRSIARLGEQRGTLTGTSFTQRPDHPPTPPHTQEQFNKTPELSHSRNPHDSPPPSVTGSISKCPIRMLDERSPEEIAEFFKSHRHEIPRSHEICVRRYQSNAQSIRELDAKYGNLANMIKGLGMKHQPLLPSKEDEEDEEDVAVTDSKSIKKVEDWANDVTDTANAHSKVNTNTVNDPDQRESHFERPLKEIRVGESPSRPWGIHVPVALSTGAARDHEDESKTLPIPDETTSKPTPLDSDGQERPTSQDKEGNPDGKPSMIFTGPVFIGYGIDQVAALIERCGLGR